MSAMYDDSGNGRTPAWVVILLLAMLVPCYFLSFSGAEAARLADNGLMTLLSRLLPLFSIIAAVCIYIAYRRDRLIAWIMLILWGLCYLGLWWWSTVAPHSAQLPLS